MCKTGFHHNCSEFPIIFIWGGVKYRNAWGLDFPVQYHYFTGPVCLVSSLVPKTPPYLSIEMSYPKILTNSGHLTMSPLSNGSIKDWNSSEGPELGVNNTLVIWTYMFVQEKHTLALFILLPVTGSLMQALINARICI